MADSNIPIPDSELAELRRLHAAATPGEWRAEQEAEFDEDGYTGEIENHLIVGPLYTQIYNGEEIPNVRDVVCAVGLSAHTKHGANKKAIIALHNAFPAILARLEAAEREREEARKENDFMRLRLAESDKACVYCALPKGEMGACASGFPGCARADDLFHCDELTRRDAQQRREGAAEAYEEMRKQAVEVGKQSGLAAKFCKIFADECIEQSAQRIREGK